VRLACSTLVVCMMHVSAAAAADAAGATDTSYGRVDGDLSAELGVGATLGPRAPRATADLRLRYLWSAGAFVTYEDGPLLGSGSEPRRVLATGLELRPLFVWRWLNGHESGSPYLDLAVDSLALELGAAFVQPEGGHLGGRPGLQAGVGAELPIFARASGPLVGVHAGVRWSDAALGGGTIDGPKDRSLYLTLTLAWQQVFGAHVVDVGDRAP
jgi:hypothetical protein